MTHALQEVRDGSNPTVIIEYKRSLEEMKRKLAEYEKKCLTVRDCLGELLSKVVEVQNKGKQEKAKLILPFLESVLVDTLQLLEGNMETSPRSPVPKKEEKKKAESKSNELEKSTVARLRNLTEKLKIAGSRLSPLSSPVLSRSQSPLTTPQTPPEARHVSENSTNNKTQPRPTDLRLESSEKQLTKEQRNRLFAERISVQALIIAEMASSLEKYQSYEPSSPAFARVSEELQELSSCELKSNSKSNLLQHSDTLAEKLILESRLVREISKLREVYSNSSQVPRCRSKSEASRRTPQKSIAGKSSSLQEMGDSSITHANISYILQVSHRPLDFFHCELEDCFHFIIMETVLKLACLVLC